MSKSAAVMFGVLMVAGLLVPVRPALAQTAGAPEVRRLYPGPPPEAAPGQLREADDPLFGQPAVRNVVDPTLRVYRAYPALARGAVAIVAPGGGFKYLAIESEGDQVARALADHGVTALVLEYRLNPLPADAAAAEAQLQAGRVDGMRQSLADRVAGLYATEGAREAIADGEAAVRYVRAHASDLGVDPGRVVFVGFSAGAMIAMRLALSHDASSRPDLVASIYGAAPAGVPVPPDAPPLFLAVAADDRLLGPASDDIFQAWRAQGRDAELHVYRTGGHGFGMTHRNGASDHWLEEFLWWLDAEGVPVR